MTNESPDEPYMQTFGINELLTKFPLVQANITQGMGLVNEDESLPYQVLNIIKGRYLEALNRNYNIPSVPFEIDNDESLTRFPLDVESSEVQILMYAAEMHYKPNFDGLGGVDFPRNIIVSGQNKEAVDKIFSVLEKIIEESDEEELLQTTLNDQDRYGHFVNEPQ